MKELLRILIRRDEPPWWWVETTAHDGVRSYMFTYRALVSFIRRKLHTMGGFNDSQDGALTSRSDERPTRGDRPDDQ